MDGLRPHRPSFGRPGLSRRLFAGGRGSCTAGMNRGSAAFHRGSPRSGGLARFLPGRTGRCTAACTAPGTGSTSLRGRAGRLFSCRGRRCSRGSIPAGPCWGFSGPMGAAGRLSCGAGLRRAGSRRGRARLVPAGGAGIARLGRGLGCRRAAGVGRSGRGGRCFPAGRTRSAAVRGHIGLSGGLAGAVYRAAACGMGRSGGLGVRPRSCRAGPRAVGLLRRGAFRSRSCRAGRRRVGSAGGRHIAVGVAGSGPHRASPGLLGPPAAPGSVRRGAAGMLLLGGTLLAGAVVSIPAAATRAAKALRAVPGPAAPPPAAKGIVRPSATLRSALGSLAAVGASAAPGAAEPTPAAGGKAGAVEPGAAGRPAGSCAESGRAGGSPAAETAACNALRHTAYRRAHHRVGQHTGQGAPRAAGDGRIQADAGDDGVRLFRHLHDGEDEHHPGQNVQPGGHLWIPPKTAF